MLRNNVFLNLNVLLHFFIRMVWGRHIKARGYFVVSSGNVTDEVIMKYIKEQGKEPLDGDFKIDEQL